MNKFEIEKGVPAPPPRTKYPWPDMEHGDSVLLPLTEGDKRRLALHKLNGSPSARIAAYMWLRRHRPGWKVVSRMDGDHVRIWFIDPNHNGDG